MSGIVTGRKAALALIVCCCLLCWPAVSFADESDSIPADSSAVSYDSLVAAQAPKSTYIVEIDRKTRIGAVAADTLDIVLKSTETPLAGFSFRIATEGRFFQIQDIIAGELPERCGWEYFLSRPLEEMRGAEAPADWWLVVALADFMPGGSPPECYSLDQPVSLCRVVVTGDPFEIPPDTAVSLFFVWESCADNTISGVSGSTLYLSQQVTDLIVQSYRPQGDPFPTVTGAPRNCVQPAAPMPPERRIQFHNGGITFLLPTLPDSADID